MLSRVLLAATFLLLLACAEESPRPVSDNPDDWRMFVSSLKMGMKASEEDPIRLRRYEILEERLEQATGLPVRIYQASDYNGIIQAMASGQIDLATMGAGSYANLHAQIGEKAIPVFTPRDSRGHRAYYSTIAVRRDDPAQSIHDLEGRSLAFVDFNSTSGYIYPRWKMLEQGIDPETFFSEVALGGGHLQTVMALANEQFDAVVVNASEGSPEEGFATGTLRRMDRVGLINLEDFREIWYAGPIARSPHVLHADVPPALRDLIVGALLSLPFDDPQTFYETGRAPGSGYGPVDRAFFKEIIEMRTQEIAKHRGRLAQRTAR